MLRALHYPRVIDRHQKTRSAKPSATPASLAPSLPNEQIVILQFLARVENHGVEDITSHEGAAQIGMAPAVFLYHVTKLVDEGLAQDSIYMGDRHYSIRPDGVGWLLDNGKMT